MTDISIAGRPFSGALISPQAALEAWDDTSFIGMDESGKAPATGSNTAPTPNAHASSSRSPPRPPNARRPVLHTPPNEREDDHGVGGVQGGGRRGDPHPPPRMFVRARFDFAATDPSALSFSAGDLIEVMTRLESGWWDGMLGSTRGWFPSNFVEQVDPAEVFRGLDDEEGDEEDDDGDFGWNDFARKKNPWGGEGEEEQIGLDDLARRVMESADMDDDDGDDVDGAGAFEAAAETRRRKAAEAQMRAMGLEGTMGLEDEGIDEFGLAARRNREEMDKTIKGLKSPTHPSTEHVLNGADGMGTTPNGERRPPAADPDSAWIPSLTQDGQVYYHNTQTGEDSWEIPVSTPGGEEEDFYTQSDENFFGNLSAGPSSAAFAHTRAGEGSLSTPTDSESHLDDEFRVPPKVQDVPAPWVSRLSDDGREWFYVNRDTRETRRDFPTTTTPVNQVEADQRTERLSVASSQLLQTRSRATVRQSFIIRKNAVEDWNRRTTHAITAVLTPPKSPNMAWHMDVINDSLRDVFEAAVAGSAADEELSRAEDLGSSVGVQAAFVREEAAVEMLRTSHVALLEVVRSLLAAFGYVGPLDGMVEMPRPIWTGDMTLIGSIGLLSANVHAAVSSKRIADSGLSNWAEVMRAASKLKDVLATFPAWVGPNMTKAQQEAISGKPIQAVFGVSAVGKMLGGKWGFGPRPTDDEPLRGLDAGVIADLQRLKMEFAQMQFSADHVLDIMRAASRFQNVVTNVDIASWVDVDGDVSDLTHEEDAQIYKKSVTGVQDALIGLEDASSLIDRSLIAMFPFLATDLRPYDSLTVAIQTSLSSLTTLNHLSAQQSNTAARFRIHAQIGHRSHHFHRTSGRPQSVTSAVSRHSASLSRSRGLEEEYLNHEEDDEYENESRDQAGEMVSASASQTSLTPQSQPLVRRHGGQPNGEMSASSSQTSLAHQESDSGSVRAKRSSLMKFMKGGRMSVDTDDGRGAGRGKPPPPPSKKLAKILGEDPQMIPSAPSIPPPIAPPAVPETPWYLGEDYALEDITFDDKGGVRAGSLRALVARLTPHGSTDTSFFQAFLLTFRSFTTGSELLDLLIERYNIEPPEGLNQGEMLDWKRLKQTPIRLRVSNTIRSWLDVHYMEAEDAGGLDRVEEFARTTLVANGSELLSKQLLSLVQRRRQGEGDSQRRIVSGGLLSPPAPLLPRIAPGKTMKLTDIAPIELARQLTILEFGFFQKIKPVECLNKAWNRSDGEEAAPNVRSVIKTANTLSGWVCTMCLSSKDAKQRAAIMKYFIQAAIELRNLNNFSSMAAVAAGLNIAPLLRLKRTKELLSQKTNSLKAELDKTLDSTKNFSNYKDMLKTINPPCVPFFGFWLSALTFIEDGNKDLVQPTNQVATPSTSTVANASSSTAVDGKPPSSSAPTTTANTSAANSTPATTDTPPKPLINFFKRSLSAEILRDIQQYQSQPYNLARCKPVYDWMIRQLDICDKTYDLNKLYDLSLQLEPREREEERITRMLHDSGFI